ncbi:unnamed protein product [Chrysodeixis includens]|uniref:AB hydrolase-1 domain-containing protein n=1 Tax=Chrysodeixis includens TaxID=689277 RepID=A0A9P0FUP3_CHRIL|nr:unnamed protein product [Chrysodeixis includens]
MNFLTKGLFIVLVLHGSNAGLFSKSKATEVTKDVNLKEESAISTESNSEAIDVMDNLALTKDGLLDFDGLIKKFKLTSIVSLIQKSITADGKLNVKTLIENFKLDELNFSSICSAISRQATKFVEKVTNNYDVIDYLTSTFVQDSEDGKLDFTGLATKYIGAIEEYDVITEDGYILKLFHIPGDESNPVLIAHGFFSSSDDFLLQGKTSLIYSLSENNHDVWVMNFRGNLHSRRHVELDPDTDKKFWEYSIHECGYYDLPAVIDFILAKTNQEKLSVIGHSAGSAYTFVLASTRPEYNDKIKVFVALAPVVYFSNPGVAFSTIIRFEPVINELLVSYGAEELFGEKKIERKIYRLLCSQGKLSYKYCWQLGFGALFGHNPDNVEPELFTSSLGHFPAGASRMNFIHYLQIGNSGKFGQYDFGRENLERYGSKEPPAYDLQRATFDVSMIVGANDKVLGLEEAERIRSEVPNVVGYQIVEDEAFSHVDFLYGKNADELVYSHVIAILNKYSQV